MSGEAARWEQRCDRLRELLAEGELGAEERDAVGTLLDELGSVLRVCAGGEGPPGVEELLEPGGGRARGGAGAAGACAVSPDLVSGLAEDFGRAARCAARGERDRALVCLLPFGLSEPELAERARHMAAIGAVLAGAVPSTCGPCGEARLIAAQRNWGMTSAAISSI